MVGELTAKETELLILMEDAPNLGAFVLPGGREFKAGRETFRSDVAGRTAAALGLVSKGFARPGKKTEAWVLTPAGVEMARSLRV